MPEAVLKRLTEYRSRAPSRKTLMSSLHEARKVMNKTLNMEEFEKELEKRKPVLEFLLETETADLEERKVSDPTKMRQSDYADPEPTEAGTPKEEKEWWINDVNKGVIEEKEEEMVTFMVLANDEDDDKTVQDEEDVLNPTPTSCQALIPRDPSVWCRRLVPEYRHSLAFTSLNRATGVELGYGELIDVNAIRTQLRKNRRKIALDPTTSAELMELHWEEQ
ncbi:hypothetical protein C2G38_2244381 [Gigaspora rosea]|uniref:Uncharacterized protein n=1 Tax=Gigaspora rosea TaxID=44941 RepID=A0A397VFH6_9GLOM|nr:hypothetical protein C2G38_2244381 [Gigaspora rosea]